MSLRFARHNYVTHGVEKEILHSKLTHPVREWIENSISSLNELQLISVPLILEHKSTLILAPTGSGKTLASFLGLIDELTRRSIEGELENKIYAVYISPLRALNNDIHKNLQLPLQGIVEYLPEGALPIKSAVRTGDTSPYEKSKMLRHPPHILITTPESLGIILASKKFSEHLRSVEWILIDEIHALASDKRGVFLSLMVEWLELQTHIPPTRIGLSATISPIDKIANFLMGAHYDERDIHIIDYGTVKKLDLEIITPKEPLGTVFTSSTLHEQIDILLELLDENQTSIIFANTRNWSERVGRDLIAKKPEALDGKIAVHHSSVDRELRFDIEDRMKRGELKAIITSASLELGIDVGSIDLAIQINSPKSVNRALQRFGRAGHFFMTVSRGKFLVSSLDELLEITAIAKLCLDGDLDKVHIPTNAEDVLAQFVVALTIVQNWKLNDMYEVVTRSFNYSNYPKSKFLRLIHSMSHPLNPEENWKYGRIWYDESTEIISRKGYQRQNFMMNVGTIPDVSNVDVVLESTRDKIGHLTERFIENLTTESVFVLGGRTFRYLRTVGNKIIVREAFNAIPTVPSWWGEAMGRSLNVSYEIGRIVEKFEEEMQRKYEDFDDKLSYLKNHFTTHYPLKEKDADSLMTFLSDQYRTAGLPTRSKLIVETYTDPAGRLIIIVLSLFGLGVNIPLAQAYAKAVTEQIGTNVGLTATDNGFSLILPFGQIFNHNELIGLIRTREQFYNLLSRALEETEIFKTRFRHTAVRGLMILKNSPRRKLGPDQIQRSAQKLIRELPEDFPLIEETKREIYQDVYDAETAAEVIIGLSSNLIQHICSDGEISPLSHSIVLTSVSDIVVNDDRQKLMIDLHQQMINKIRESTEILFDPDVISKYFSAKLSDTNKYSDESRLTTYIIREKPSFEELVNNGCDRIQIDPDQLIALLKSSHNYLKFNDQFLHRDILLIEIVNDSTECREIQWFDRELTEDECSEIFDLINYVPPIKLLENAIQGYLRSVGPQNLSQLLHEFHVEENLLKEAIFSLQRTDVILAGEFTEDIRQYMLNEDRKALSEIEENNDIFTLSQLNHLRLRIQYLTRKLEGDTIDTLKAIGPVRHVADIANRGYFAWSELRLALDSSEIYYGKFFAGKQVFLHNSLVPLFIRIYRKITELDEGCMEILDLLSYREFMSFSELMYSFDSPSEHIRDRLRLLENEMYICRVGWDLSTSYAQRNVIYKIVPFEWKRPTDRDFADFFTYLLTWYGPLTIENLLKISKLEYGVIEKSLRMIDIESHNIFSKDYLYYGLSDQFQRMQNIPPDKEFPSKILALSSFDPYLNTTGTVFSSLSMTSDTYRLLYRGKIVGSVITTPKNDYLEITNLMIPTILRDDPSFVSELAATFFQIAKTIYLMKSVIIEEIRSNPPNFPENELFTIIMRKNGFHLDVDHLVGGMTHSSEIGISDIIEVKLHNLISYFEKEMEIEELIQNLGKFTEATLISYSNLALPTIRYTLSRMLKDDELWYKDGTFYTSEYWNLMDEERSGLTDEEQTILDLISKRIDVQTLSSKLRQTDSAVNSLILNLKRRNLIDLVNPYDTVPIWRPSNRKLSPQNVDIYKKLFSIIRIHGPISFHELLNKYNEFSNFSRTFILLNLAKLIESRRVDTIWLGETQRQIFYFCPELSDLFKNPTRSSKLPKWMLADSHDLPMRELLGISNLYFNGMTHALFKEGKIVSTLKIEVLDDELVIVSMRLVDDLSDEDLFGIIHELEMYSQKLRKSNIIIEKIFDQTIEYWRS